MPEAAPDLSTTVDVLLTRLDRWIARLDELRSLLDPAERGRSERFLADRDRDRWQAGRAFLRRALGDRLGTHPATVRFETAPGGKPRLADGGPFFNYSRSGSIAAVALTAAAEVGVDVEAVLDLDDLDSMAQRFFAPSEVAGLMALAPAARTEAFYRIWTRKEAVVKAEGSGLSIPLDSFAVTSDHDPLLLAVSRTVERLNGYSLLNLEAGPGMAGAVAVAAVPAALEVGWMTPD